ncbi:hypothetical protein QTP86_014036, partial [Hemibagrus guttatus]
KNSFIYSLSTAYPIYSRVTGSLCLSQASLGIKAGYTLDGVPTHRTAHTHTHSHSLTQSHTTDNLVMPINLQCMSSDRRRKPPRHGEHMQTPHTHGGGGNRAPNPGGTNIPSIRKQATSKSQGSDSSSG